MPAISSKLRRRIAAERHIIDLIVDQLKIIESVPVQLPYPVDLRAKKLAKILSVESGDRRPLEDLCSECGASKRTMQRLFIEETGMSFTAWRQRLRLIGAMQRLATGESVTAAALDAGYNTLSAFIAMFRRQLGTTPTRYLAPDGQRSRSASMIYGNDG